MKLELPKKELSYLITIIEEKLESDETTKDLYFMNMVHKLYSKLVIRENEDFNIVV